MGLASSALGEDVLISSFAVAVGASLAVVVGASLMDGWEGLALRTWR